MSTENQLAEVDAWADSMVEKVSKVLAEGIPADLYDGYPSPVEGFCFELYADLPFHNKPLMSEIHVKLGKMPAFVDLSQKFRQVYGRNPL